MQKTRNKLIGAVISAFLVIIAIAAVLAARPGTAQGAVNNRESIIYRAGWEDQLQPPCGFAVQGGSFDSASQIDPYLANNINAAFVCNYRGGSYYVVILIPRANCNNVNAAFVSGLQTILGTISGFERHTIARIEYRFRASPYTYAGSVTGPEFNYTPGLSSDKDLTPFPGYGIVANLILNDPPQNYTVTLRYRNASADWTSTALTLAAGTVPTVPANVQSIIDTPIATDTAKCTFTGWDKSFAAVSGNTTYTARYNAEFLVTFMQLFEQNIGGLPMVSWLPYPQWYAEGAIPELPELDREKKWIPTTDIRDEYPGVTLQYVRFSGWDKSATPVIGPAEYKAIYTPGYRLTWQYKANDDTGAVTDITYVSYAFEGTAQAYQPTSGINAGLPIWANQYIADGITYTFAEWSPSANVEVTEDMTFTALYNRTIEINFEWLTADNTLQSMSTITPVGAKLGEILASVLDGMDAPETVTLEGVRYVRTGWGYPLDTAITTAMTTIRAEYKTQYAVTWHYLGADYLYTDIAEWLDEGASLAAPSVPALKLGTFRAWTDNAYTELDTFPAVTEAAHYYAVYDWPAFVVSNNLNDKTVTYPTAYYCLKDGAGALRPVLVVIWGRDKVMDTFVAGRNPGKGKIWTCGLDIKDGVRLPFAPQNSSELTRLKTDLRAVGDSLGKLVMLWGYDLQTLETAPAYKMTIKAEYKSGWDEFVSWDWLGAGLKDFGDWLGGLTAQLASCTGDLTCNALGGCLSGFWPWLIVILVVLLLWWLITRRH